MTTTQGEYAAWFRAETKTKYLEATKNLYRMEVRSIADNIESNCTYWGCERCHEEFETREAALKHINEGYCQQRERTWSANSLISRRDKLLRPKAKTEFDVADNSTPWVCSHCGERFSRKRTLRLHKYQAHSY